METIDLEQLDTVSGGNAFTSWLDGIYHDLVGRFAGHVGGNKVAEAMYGKHATAKDRARSQAALQKYIADGHKLPKGVPNIFG